MSRFSSFPLSLVAVLVFLVPSCVAASGMKRPLVKDAQSQELIQLDMSTYRMPFNLADIAPAPNDPNRRVTLVAEDVGCFCTFAPTYMPTALPSLAPTPAPSVLPTMEPTEEPSFLPTAEPTVAPTFSPTFEPTFPGGGNSPISRTPTMAPSNAVVSVAPSCPTGTCGGGSIVIIIIIKISITLSNCAYGSYVNQLSLLNLLIAQALASCSQSLFSASDVTVPTVTSVTAAAALQAESDWIERMTTVRMGDQKQEHIQRLPLHHRLRTANIVVGDTSADQTKLDLVINLPQSTTSQYLNQPWAAVNKTRDVLTAAVAQGDFTTAMQTLAASDPQASILTTAQPTNFAITDAEVQSSSNDNDSSDDKNPLSNLSVGEQVGVWIAVAIGAIIVMVAISYFLYNGFGGAGYNKHQSLNQQGDGIRYTDVYSQTNRPSSTSVTNNPAGVRA